MRGTDLRALAVWCYKLGGTSTLKSLKVFVGRPLSHAHLYCRLKLCSAQGLYRTRHEAEVYLAPSLTVSLFPNN